MLLQTPPNWWRAKGLHPGGRRQGWQPSVPKGTGRIVTLSKPEPPALSSSIAREFSFPDCSVTCLIKSAKIKIYFEATECNFPAQVSVNLIQILHKKLFAYPELHRPIMHVGRAGCVRAPGRSLIYLVSPSLPANLLTGKT